MKITDILNQVRAVEEKKLKEEHVSGADPRVLTFKKGATYKGRLLYNEKDVDNTFVSYEDVGFTSKSGNSEYVFLGRSPTNAGVPIKNDLIRKTQWDEYKKAKDSGDEVGAKAACVLIPSRKQLVNFYLHEVEGDDKAKEKVGQVVVLKYPARVDKDKKPSSEIYKIVFDGVFGEKAKKIGGKAFDLSPDGRSLEIKVGAKGDWNTYSASFDDADDLGLSDKEIAEKFNQVHDLTEFVPAVKSDEEIRQLLDEHWFVKNASLEDDIDGLNNDDDDDLDYSPTSSSSTVNAEDIDSILDGITTK
jgi:hypothetical protein